MSQTTKKALAAALKKLMEHKTLDKITVKDVVTDCKVNRQTFYYHFQDIYELLGWIYKTEALGGITELKTYDTWQQGFLKIFYYVRDNKAFCMSTLQSLGRDHLENFLYEVVFDLLMGVVNEVAENTPVREHEKEFIANFYSYGFIGLMMSWMRSGMKEDPEIIINDLNKLIEGDIKKAIDKYI
ncbi:MAG: dihydroxyacetone kinase transcriptional activator DhaS [Cellulosilyticaceae bacterium]